MSKLMTKDYVSQIQFYQMPKVFFQDPAYMSMRCESKLAYMLMLDLLPLSIKNNWINERNEVFVKISREKLMALLNVKGTQKAAQIMKELVSYKLIIYKRVGLARCNEIYLYHFSGSQDHVDEIPKGHVSKPSEPREPSPADEIRELEEAINEVEDLLENQVHMADLRQKYDPELVDEIGNNICEMFLSPSTRIGQQDKPMRIVRDALRKLKMHHIEHVIDRFKESAARAEIFNPKRYIQTMIYNSVYEANIKLTGDVGFNFGYC